MYLKIENTNIYYQKLGTGKDLILLHGWGQDVSTWWGVVDELKDTFTIYLLDLPGFGRSDKPTRPLKMDDYAKTVSGFIKQKGLKKPILLGHSHGGRTAIKLVYQNPELVGKLILVDAAGIKPKRDFLKEFIYPVAKLSHIVPNWFNLKEKLRWMFYKSLEADYITAGDLKATLKNILEEDLTPLLPKIQNETLLIWGGKDPTKEASLENGKLMYKKIKNSRLEIIEDAGHFPHLEKPDKFIYFLKDFGS